MANLKENLSVNKNATRGVACGGIANIAVSIVLIGLELSIHWPATEGEFKDLLTRAAVWILIDRFFTLICSVSLLYGVSALKKEYLTPYIAWGCVNKIVNFAFCILFMHEIHFLIYIAWLLICIELFHLVYVIKEYQRIEAKLNLAQEWKEGLASRSKNDIKFMAENERLQHILWRVMELTKNRTVEKKEEDNENERKEKSMLGNFISSIGNVLRGGAGVVMNVGRSIGEFFSTESMRNASRINEVFGSDKKQLEPVEKETVEGEKEK